MERMPQELAFLSRFYLETSYLPRPGLLDKILILCYNGMRLLGTLEGVILFCMLEGHESLAEWWLLVDRSESESEATQSCPTLFYPMDCSVPSCLSMGFSRQEYWSGLPFPTPGDLPNPGIEPGSPTLWADALPSEPPGKFQMTEAKMTLKSPAFKPLYNGFL